MSLCLLSVSQRLGRVHVARLSYHHPLFQLEISFFLLAQAKKVQSLVATYVLPSSDLIYTVRLQGSEKGRCGVCRDLDIDLKRIKSLGVGCIVWCVSFRWFSHGRVDGCSD
jgi:hypothetical protein